MEAPETPLVLLSHAAAFVNRDAALNHVADYEDKDVPSSKSVTVKSQKLKRSNDKGDFPTSIGPTKIKRPLQFQSSNENSKLQIDETDVTVLRRDSQSMEKQNDPSPYSNRLYDPCHCENPDEDKPLDMSIKCGMVEQQRPSVITCAPTLLRKAQENNNKVPRENPVVITSGTKTAKQQRNRTEIASGMCDPVIDEHFRRSLGKDYPQIFSAPAAAASVSITVDDHFAKALGETWQRLQEKPSAASSPSVPSPVKETDKSAKLSSSPSLVTQGLITL